MLQKIININKRFLICNCGAPIDTLKLNDLSTVFTYMYIYVIIYMYKHICINMLKMTPCSHLGYKLYPLHRQVCKKWTSMTA